MINRSRADRTKSIKFNLIDVIGLLTSTIKRWPATMLAASRTDNVKGRITLLVSSIITINGIRV